MQPLLWMTMRVFLMLIVAAGAASAQDRQLGDATYTAHCASCHSDAGVSRSPSRVSLASMSPRAILYALEQGRMEEHGEALSAEERRTVSEWLAGRPLTESQPNPDAVCSRPAMHSDVVYWSGWGGDPQGTGFQPADRAGLSASDVPRLELLWAFGFPDASEARSKPAIVGDQLIVGSQLGQVYSLDVITGCIRWMFEADASVRSAITIGNGPDGTLAAYVVDFRTNVYALDVRSGALLWKQRAGRHSASSNTGSSIVHDGRVIVPLSSTEVVTALDPGYECCTSSGAVVALDALTGDSLWHHRIIGDSAVEVGRNAGGARILAPSGAIVWSSPTIDPRRNLVYVGTGENYTRPTTATSDAIVAIDLETGVAAWSFQATADDAFNMACTVRQNRDNCPTPMGPDLDFGMAPILIPLAGNRDMLVVGQKSGMVYGLDPDRKGDVMWSTRIGKGGALGGIHWGMATDGRLVFAANADNPLGMFGGSDPSPNTPGIFALDALTGDVVWETPTPHVCEQRRNCYRANSAQPSVIPGVVLAGGLDGHLRAYSTDTGQILWVFDTATKFETVNGIPGNGGSIDGPGPVIAHGMVFVNSGYALFNEMPGNVLLAFGVPREGVRGAAY